MMRISGTVKFMRRDYGFIIRGDTGCDIFVHSRDVVDDATLSEGDRVSFIEAKSRDGRPCAKEVALILQARS